MLDPHDTSIIIQFSVLNTQKAKQYANKAKQNNEKKVYWSRLAALWTYSVLIDVIQCHAFVETLETQCLLDRRSRCGVKIQELLDTGRNHFFSY